jgi:succinate dehydrogenase / fumarate reductase cytochrome b subunit
MSAQNRPLSPHLQVYKPQLTSVMSISHRATGIALAAGTLLLVWWLLAAAAGPEAFASAQAFLGSWFGLVVLFGFTYALMYHLCNGIRHLFWDAGYGFDLETVHTTGWLTVAGSVVLTLVAWVISASAS